MAFCSKCDREFEPARVEFDASEAVGMDGVKVDDMPALVCRGCGAQLIDGPAIEWVEEEVARKVIARKANLVAKEVRFLRNFMDLTQDELADRLGVKRATVWRWETGEVPPGRAVSIAFRTLAAWAMSDPSLAERVASPSIPPTEPQD